MSAVEQDVAEYYESLARKLGEFVDTLGVQSSLDRNFVEALRAAAEEIRTDAQRLASRVSSAETRAEIWGEENYGK